MVTELENKRTALLPTNYKPEDRLVASWIRQIAFTRTELSDATTVKSLETTTDIDPVWQQLRTSTPRPTSPVALEPRGGTLWRPN